MKRAFFQKTKAFFTAAIITGCFLLWLQGFLGSPIWQSEVKNEHNFLKKYIAGNSIDYSHEKLLAEAYWLRYRDVMDNPYWGRNSTQNIWGPRDHFRLHGRKEGRIFGALPRVTNMGQEEELAKIYWQRYPDIADSPIWGQKSQLGILGPRDHFYYVGRWQGRVWGHTQTN